MRVGKSPRADSFKFHLRPSLCDRCWASPWSPRALPFLGLAVGRRWEELPAPHWVDNCRVCAAAGVQHAAPSPAPLAPQSGGCSRVRFLFNVPPPLPPPGSFLDSQSCCCLAWSASGMWEELGCRCRAERKAASPCRAQPGPQSPFGDLIAEEVLLRHKPLQEKTFQSRCSKV